MFCAGVDDSSLVTASDRLCKKRNDGHVIIIPRRSQRAVGRRGRSTGHRGRSGRRRERRSAMPARGDYTPVRPLDGPASPAPKYKFNASLIQCAASRRSSLTPRTRRNRASNPAHHACTSARGTRPATPASTECCKKKNTDLAFLHSFFNATSQLI